MHKLVPYLQDGFLLTIHRIGVRLVHWECVVVVTRRYTRVPWAWKLCPIALTLICLKLKHYAFIYN
ncbi:hypothetical protein HanXRQr2_Chr13g0618341 [Helianthus annuus]|uniref:Uncharacterized protein n=1 Tax=Helianthus annuus TaxID=4232 RepID=A0A9K3EPS0_HELAN|nr:hypothetical protein HanXRQr2_Chr13g0618341 [Helianthus annuus]